MLKALIVDDEYLIYNGLMKHIDWNTLGFELIGAVDNPMECLKICEKNQPHLVITDINMPIMNGLVMVEELRNISPSSTIVIISGYDDFEYAKRAITLNVFDYILKPINLEAFAKIIQKAAQKIEKDINEKKYKSTVHSLPAINVDWVIKELIENRLTEQTISKEHHKLLAPYKNKLCIALTIIIDDFETSFSSQDLSMQNLWDIKFYNAISVFSTPNIFTSLNGKGHYAACIFDDNQRSLIAKANKFSENIRISINKIGYTASIGLGKIQTSIFSLNISYSQARSAMLDRFVQGKNSTLIYKEKKDSVPIILPDLFSNYYEQLSSCIISNQKVKIHDILNLLRVPIKQFGQDIQSYTKIVIHDILSKIKENVSLIYSDFDNQYNPLNLTTQITNHQTLDDIINHLEMVLISLCTTVSNCESGFRSAIERVKKYLSEHYTDENIRLDEIAKLQI